MRPGDLAGKPYAEFWNPTMAPLPDHVRQALAVGPIADPLLPPLSAAVAEIEAGSGPVDTGFCVMGSGEARVAVRTDMPNVTPAMFDRWMGWHGDEPQKYKLWHPQAHIHVAWDSAVADGVRGRERYVGRVSVVNEYIGSTRDKLAIAFLPPAALGFDESLLSDPEKATAVCTRAGFADRPVDFANMVHYVVRTDAGSEMRSRFWLGGSNATARRGGKLATAAVKALQRVRGPGATLAEALVVHCSQEMSHLASFLPALYAELGDQ
jgi:hypothetical protein